MIKLLLIILPLILYIIIDIFAVRMVQESIKMKIIPNLTRPFGILQPVTDRIKLLFKNKKILLSISRLLFYIPIRLPFSLALSFFLILLFLDLPVLYCMENTPSSNPSSLLTTLKSFVSSLSIPPSPNLPRTGIYGSYGEGTFDSIRYGLDLELAQHGANRVPVVNPEAETVVPVVSPTTQTAASRRSFFSSIKSLICGCFN